MDHILGKPYLLIVPLIRGWLLAFVIRPDWLWHGLSAVCYDDGMAGEVLPGGEKASRRREAACAGSDWRRLCRPLSGILAWFVRQDSRASGFPFFFCSH